jgi:hypothetical protein
MSFKYDYIHHLNRQIELNVEITISVGQERFVKCQLRKKEWTLQEEQVRAERSVL